ncbi:MAG: hypothetical protein R3D25_06270 [Geminicoccaceae bacterium]
MSVPAARLLSRRAGRPRHRRLARGIGRAIAEALARPVRMSS